MFSGLFQPLHLIVILVIVMIIWGPGKLPELGSGLAKGIKEFKKNLQDQPAKPAPLEHNQDKTE